MGKKDICFISDDLRFNYRVACIMECDGKVLIHKPSDVDFWNLPGGRVKFCEHSLDALKRELNEEIGFEFNDADCEFFGISENFFPFMGNDVHEMLFLYKIKVDKNNPIAKKQNFGCNDKEGVVYFWCDIDKINNYKCLPRLIYDFVKLPNGKFYHHCENDLKK